MTTLSQRSFTAGEISPALYRHVDMARYANGLKTLRNMRVMRHGGAQNRPGDEFICEAKTRGTTHAQVRIIPFEFNDDQTYELVFGYQYMRVIKDGALLTASAKNITGATNANPCVVTAVGHGYTTSDHVDVESITGPIGRFLNGRVFKITVLTVDTFSLAEIDGTGIDSTSYGAYTSGGTSSKIYEITTPYDDADLFDIHIAQQGDIITLTHPSYGIRELSRTGDTSWTLSAINFTPDQTWPTEVTFSVPGTGSPEFNFYRVTAVSAETGEESIAGYGVTRVITGITRASPAVVTSNGHGLADGQEILITGVVGMTQVNNLRFVVAGETANTFQLQGIDSSAYTAYASGGAAQPTYITVLSNDPTGAAPIQINVPPVSGAGAYNVYGARQTPYGVYGFLGTVKDNGFGNDAVFDDVGLDPDFSLTPPLLRDPFADSGDYPSTVAVIQQRKTFAGSDNNPERIDMSKSGQYRNFTVSSPLRDDDSVSFSMAGNKVERVKHVVDLGSMVVLTGESEHSIGGDSQSGVIRPGEINPKKQSGHGASNLQPIFANASLIFVQAQGSIVRDLAFQIQSDGYNGNDLTTFSAHMVDKYTLLSMAYQKVPHPIVWIVRDDGTLIGMTYVTEENIIAWHRHDTDGEYECVSTINEGNETSVYVVVNRTINGTVRRYIERFASRDFDDVIDAAFMDSFLTYDGRNTGSRTMTLSLGNTWKYDELLTCTASTGFFTSDDVGNRIDFTDSDNVQLRFTITGFTSTTVVTGFVNRTVPAGLRMTATTTWCRSVDTLQGLWHLEGKRVSVFADRFVVGSPNNDAYPVYTVANGQITLDTPAGVIHVGLPYLSDIETLDIDTAQGEPLIGKKKRIGRVIVSCVETRGIWAGPRPPDDDDVDPLQYLTEKKIRDEENYDDPVALLTGDAIVNIKANWNSSGHVFVRQVDPLPWTVSAISAEGQFPFRQAGS